jgi:hypothetical protein
MTQILRDEPARFRSQVLSRSITWHRSRFSRCTSSLGNTPRLSSTRVAASTPISSEAEAQKKCETFQQLVEPEVGAAPLGRMLGVLFRTEYEGRTLRQNLGLARPVNRFA